MKKIIGALLLAILPGCTSEVAEGDNPFLADYDDEGKADTQYMNPDGIEVEVDLEADVEASSYAIREAPAKLGQYALTYLRKRGDFYLESLAEDSTSSSRVEWRVDGTWLTASQASSVAASKLTHFRIRGVNAVLLYDASDGVTVGKVFTAEVPRNPDNVYSQAGDKCADPDDHMSLDQSIYWYMWNPDKSTCTLSTQNMSVTVSKMFQSTATVYPEYDRLVADGKVTAVVLFGLIGDDMVETDQGFRAMKTMATWLKNASYKEITPAPLGRRFTKRIGNVDFEIDLYSPREFSGLGDSAHFANFQKAISEHEIVAYDGHSMLGASDFWERPTYPSFYQIYLYGGCLGYEYYIRPILAGKGGWANLDILSAVVEVTADANDFAAPVLAKIAYTLNHGMKSSWQTNLKAVRTKVGDSTFGLSGVRENCYTPAGSRCTDAPRPTTAKRYENSTALSIPDNNTTGVTSTIKITDTTTPTSLKVELNVAHTYVGDLNITLSHNGVEQTVWAMEGGSADAINKTITLTKFSGSISGLWNLRLVDTAAQDTGSLTKWAIIAE